MPTRAIPAAALLALGLAASSLAAPAAQARTAYPACHCTARHAQIARLHRRPRNASVPHIPRYDPAEVWAEVHAVARYRTPYAYPAVFGPW